MKKQRKNLKSGKRKGQASAENSVEQSKAERKSRAMRISRRAAIALPVLAIAGYFSVQSVEATICEADLTKIDNGKPSIVQIHDPQCQLCQTLQRQARKAMKSFDSEAFTYLVANIRTDDGIAFSARYGVPHVTLLLFDAQGQMVEIVRGPSDVESLTRIFASHLEAHG